MVLKDKCQISKGPTTWRNYHSLKIFVFLHGLVTWLVMQRNVWERYCKLANKTTQQLHKESTPCIDDHHFKEEEMKSVGELSQVCSQIVLKCLYLARIGWSGSVNGGWLGRVCTILHLHAPYITHSTRASFVWFAFLSAVFLHTMFSRVFAAFPSRRWSGCAALNGCRAGLWISPSHPVWSCFTLNENVSMTEPGNSRSR